MGRQLSNIIAGLLLESAVALNFSTLVVFGDSYTDNGVHTYSPDVNGTVGTPIPKKSVTSTGGRVWAEYVGQYSGAHIYDYAVSGAVCDKTMAPRRNGVSQNQVAAFLEDNLYVSNTTGEGALVNPPDETVYAIWIGTNDIGNGGFLTEVQQPNTLPLTSYIDCAFDQFDRLYEVGARKFVLMNVAALDLAPQYALPQNGGLNSSQYWTDKLLYDTNITHSSEKMREYSTLANAVYEYRLPYEVEIVKRYPGSWFALFDVHSLFENIRSSPSSYLNGTAPLNVTGWVAACKNSTCPDLAARDSYMWYDELHPSEQTDRVVAREFVNAVLGQSNWTTYWGETAGSNSFSDRAV
ncbi:hypothetical protein SCAR479_03275 [Seiridium cardinale]|uniref:Uncharacterized protein n=1 Tax=Seiridium cardinale TaxID=138064 RepID=A0ABR2Y0T0_9PEZI